MTECRQIAEWITTYVDGHLAVPARGEVERHVAACPPCRVRLAEEQGARAALRHCAERLSDQPLPPGLETRCQALARELGGRRAVTGGRRLAVAGLVAVLILQVLTGRSTAVLAAQLTMDHVKCFAVFMPRETTGGEAGRAEQQLASYGWQMRVPASSPEAGLRLLGVRRCLYADGKVPHVMYEANGKPLSLFALEGLVRPAAIVSSLGHQCRIWQRDNRTFVLVGPGDAGPELARIARYVEREAR
jgi:anti-sigma factor RsiW